MSATLESQVSDLRKEGASLKESVETLSKSMGTLVDKLNQPVYPRVMHAGSDTLGFWGEGETIVAHYDAKDGPRPLPKSAKRLPKGYKNSLWKTASDFYRDGFLAHKEQRAGEFRERHSSVFKAIQGMSVQEGSSAGFTVLPEFNNQILERVYANDLWNRTQQYTVNNNMVFLANAETSRATGSRHGGLRGYWVDEASAHTKSKPTMRRIELSLKKLSVLVYLTEELIADTGIALEQWINQKAAEEFNFMLGDSVFNGSGVQQPLGILNAPSLLAITKESGQGAATIVTENIDKMWARRIVGGNYSWYHNQDCNPQLDQLTQDVGTGGVVLNRPNGIAGEMAQTLKTAQRVETEFNSTLGTIGDIVLADLGQYITINKGGINQAMSSHVEFLTDQLAVKFTMRLNGRPWDTAPITPYKGSNTQSAFLALETR